MSEGVEAPEFAFVERFPKQREIVDEFEQAMREMQAAWKEARGFLTPGQAAIILGVTQSTVSIYADRGTLRSYTLEIGDKRFRWIYASDVRDRLQKEVDKGGRPRKLSLKDQVKVRVLGSVPGY